MAKHLVLIDNVKKELEALERELHEEAGEKGIIISSIIYDENNKRFFSDVKKRINDIITNDNDPMIKLRIVCDACLTSLEENNIMDLDLVKSVTGIQQLLKIDKFLKTKGVEYDLYLMSGFISKKLRKSTLIKPLNELGDVFAGVIDTPVLEDYEIDYGSDEVPNYVGVLPEELITNNNLQSFINIVFYKL